MPKVPFVHSNYPRVPGDYYPTIDSRCVDGLLEFISPAGLCVDVCATQGSGIVDALIERGYKAQCESDAFVSGLKAVDWIVTNPPYKRDLVDQIIKRQIERVDHCEVFGLAVLLRSGFDFAKSRISMFRNCTLYYGQVKLLFRPYWSEERKAQPIHNYVWHIWTEQKTPMPRVMYAEGKRTE